MLAVILNLIQLPMMWVLPLLVATLALLGLFWLVGLLVSLSETSE